MLLVYATKARGDEPVIVTGDKKDYASAPVAVTTPAELVASLPKKITIKSPLSPEVGMLRARLRWPGHFHDDDLEAIVGSLAEAYPGYKFALKEPLTGMFDVGGEYEVAGPGEGKTRLVVDGIHGYAEPRLLWDIADAGAVARLFRASKAFREKSERSPVEVCAVNAAVNGWDVGGEWEVPRDAAPRLFANRPDTATIYLSTTGNRDVYDVVVEIPPARWVWNMLEGRDKYDAIAAAVWECRDTILSRYALHTDVKVSFEKKLLKPEGEKRADIFKFTMRMKLDDLDFGEYEGIASVLRLAGEVKTFFDKKGIEIGGRVDYPPPPRTCPYCGDWALFPPEDHIIRHISRTHPDRSVPDEYREAAAEKAKMFSEFMSELRKKSEERK